MSQALYDALNGMSPEELWARYKQYPWKNNQGKLVMQGEPDQYRGPGLPNGVKAAKLPSHVMGVTLIKPPRTNKYTGILLNNTLDISSLVKALNHEKQHEKQIDTNLPLGPIVDLKQKTNRLGYTDNFGEEQARMAGNRSALSDVYKSVVHPYSQMYPDEGGDFRAYDIENRLGSKAQAYTSLIAQLAKYGNGVRMQDSQEAVSNQMQDRGLTIEEVLDQLRKRYIPPFLSPGLQE